jgi:signal peptidase II|tara:strand:+ start:859 stop:1368 length:510 start_codon:yes stop_codon:yes gene_type:complete
MQKLLNFNYKILILNSLIVILIFSLDRTSKLYLLNLAEEGVLINFYIFSFLNVFLTWNTGIGFGLFSFDSGFIYNLISILIGIINLVIIFMAINMQNINRYFLLIILGGSLGNFFDRIYYSAVPDFLDLHIGDFHWFIFNIADVFISIGILCLIFVEIFGKNINKGKNE